MLAFLSPEIFICSIECWSARRLEFIGPADTKHFAPPETLLTLLGPHLNMILYGFEYDLVWFYLFFMDLYDFEY